MKLFDVCIRAFVKGNLGDDLFIDTLCRRYPDTKFVLCGESAYRRCFENISNLTYVAYDTFLCRLIFRSLKLPIMVFNKISKKLGWEKFLPYFGCEQFFQTVSKRNVLISGSIFMELPGMNFQMSPYYLGEVKYYKKHPYVIGCNFGPYYNEEYRQFYQKQFENAGQVCFREKHSFELFEGENIQCGTDILFSYPTKEYESPAQQGYVAISVLDLNKDNEEDGEKAGQYVTAVSGLVQELLNRGEKIVLMGFCEAQRDNLVIDKVFEACHRSPEIIICNYPEKNYREMVGILAGAKSIVSTRYHGMILGWLYGKKVLPIIYSSKMQHVIDDAGLDIEVCNLLHNELRADSLITAYDRMMNDSYNIDIDALVEGAEMHFKKLDQELLQVGE